MALFCVYSAHLPVFILFLSYFVHFGGGGNEPGWFVGCYTWPTSGLPYKLYEGPAGQSNNPALCSKSCLDEGYQIAVLSSERCHCADLPVEDLLLKVFQVHSQNISGGTDQSDEKNIMGCKVCGRNSSSPSQGHFHNISYDSFKLQGPHSCNGSLCLPIGEEFITVAVYQTLGPYIHNISLSTIVGEEEAGNLFLLEVSGYLAASPWQSTGLKGLQEVNVSLVDVEISWSPSIQSKHRATAHENGYFALSPGWMLGDPGMYHINVTVSNGISSQFGSTQIRVHLPRPAVLEVILSQEYQDIPSCISFPVQHTQATEKVFLGVNTTFRAVAFMGINLNFSWYFEDDNQSLHTGPDCLPVTGCFSCTVNHTFGKEGIYAVSVNVSNVYGWIQKTIHIVVVQRVLTNLTLVSPSGCNVAVGQTIPLELELLTTMHHLLTLEATLEPGVTCRCPLDGNSSTEQASGCLWLIHLYGSPSCRLRVQLLYSYSSSGFVSTSITVFSPIGVHNAALPCPLRVYKPISDLGLVQEWSSVSASGISATLRVISKRDCTASTVQWTVTRDNATVSNQTSEDWVLVLTLLHAGQYFLDVNVFKPFSRVSFCTELLIQDAISGLFLLSCTQKYVETSCPVMLQATVTPGTNVTYLWKFGKTSSFQIGPGTLTQVFSQPDIYTVTARAENNVSQVHSSFQLKCIVQDAVRDLTACVPSIITVKKKTISLFAITGSNISITLFSNDSFICGNKSFELGAKLLPYLVFEQTGPLQVTVKASIHVSSMNITWAVLVLQELLTITVELTPTLVPEKSVLLSASIIGHILPTGKYFYTWRQANCTVHSSSPLLFLSCKETGSHSVNVTVADYTCNISAGLRLNVTWLNAAIFLSHPLILPIRTPVSFSVQNSSCYGSLDVNLGDGNETTVFSSGGNWFVFNHTYSQAGIYYVTVAADGEKLLSALVDVQEPIEGLQLMGPETFTLPASPSKTAVITWSARVSRGSSCVYQWTVSDGKKSVSVVGTDRFTVEVCEPVQLRTEVWVTNGISGLTANLSTFVLQSTTDVIPSLQITAPWLDISWDLHQPSISFCLQEFNLSIKATAQIPMEDALSGAHLVLTTPAVTKLSSFINVTSWVQMEGDATFHWQVLLPNFSVYRHIDKNTNISSLTYQAQVPGTHKVSVFISSSLSNSRDPIRRDLFVKVRGPINAICSQLPLGKNYAVLHPQHNGSYATQALTFTSQVFSEDVNFIFSFGDGSPLFYVKGSSHGLQWCSVASISHQFTEEGVVFITVAAYNEFYNMSVVQPFYIEKMPTDLQLIFNSSFVYKNEVLRFNAELASGTNVTYTWKFGNQSTYVTEGPEVYHRFLTSGMNTVSVEAQNRVGSLNTSASILVLPQTQSVRIHTEKQTYLVGAIITFLAMCEEPDPLEFLWHFGEGPMQRTVSRSITKKYHFPGRYNIVVHASSGRNTFISDIHPIVVQRKVQINRLLFNSSVLLNTTVPFDCRINAGTNVTYAWSFGDGTYKTGGNTEHHIYEREGEFTVEVTVSNLVSSASLRRQIFVVSQPCHPPPVKNMGPVRIQVRRYQTIHLGVTYDGDIHCNISQGLLYSWALYESTGTPVQLSHIETQQQRIQLPSHFLHYGIYTVIAKVQIQGSVVYSNYTVHVEVVPSPPVCLIYGGTNIFISISNSSVLTLNGQGSYDPDYLENILRYQWHCKPVSNTDSTCFDEDLPTSSPVLVFPSSYLKSSYDQFKFTLTVMSGDRSTSSEVFVTVTSHMMRKMQVHCENCQGTTVNWNEQFSVKTLCENCEMPPEITFYTWDLYLVNASSKVVTEIPFCSVLDLTGPSRMVEAPSFVLTHLRTINSRRAEMASPITPGPLLSSASSPPTSDTYRLFPPHPGSQSRTSVLSSTPAFEAFLPFPLLHPEENVPSVRLPREQKSTQTSSDSKPSSDFEFFPLFTERFKIPVPPYYISEFPVSDDGSILYDDPFLDHPAESPVSESSYHTEHSETPLDGSGLHTEGSGTLTGEEIIRLNYKDWSYFTDIEEGSIGNSRGIEKDSYGSSEDFLGSKNGEDNLMDSSKPSYTAPEKTLLDLERRQINPAEFITYTTTGINSHMIRFKPFALKPKTQYMLEVSASAQQTLLGKTQFFFSTDEIPQGMACQAQPTKGYEIHTEFSIFCSSGKMDLLYKYSYSTGRSQRRVLYQGRDFQYYFSLPSGEPQDNYKVTIYTEVWNQFGAATRPCPVSVQVLPSYQRNVSSAYSPDQRLYLDGLETLTKLALKGNGQEVRNHIFLFTNVLNRLSQEPLGSRELQTITRSVLISAVSQQTIPDQVAMMDTIYILKDLVSVTNQVTFESARLVPRFVQDMLSQFCEQNGEDNCFLDEMTVPALVSLLSFTLETLMRISKKNTQLISHVIHTAADLLLKHVLFSQASEYSLSTSLMEVKTFLLHRSFQKMVKNVGSTKFYFPDGLNVHIHGHNVAGPYLTDHCIVGQLMSFKQSPYLWEKSHIQMHGHVADMALYNCSTRTEIKIQHFSVPITAEFQPRAQNRSGALQFSLQRSHMNVHQFNVTPENLQEVLLVTLHFDRPTNRTFPIMILLRIFERPTPTVYNVKKIHRWEGDTALVFLPLSSLSGPSRIYLALLNANYNEVHGNKYVTSSVNYTMVIECIQCLFWDGVGEWKPDGCIAVEAESSSGFKCSCNHLTTFTAAYREIQSHLEFICVSHFVSLHSNLTLCSVALISLVVYLLSAVFCKQADAQYRERGLVHLPDNSLSDRQLYAVTVDTGFRSRPTMTAKVHIVLHGENVISQTRELHFSNQLLFARNSRHTFILSTPESLGPIWKVHLWHDNRGSSPSWYISHVAVRDLMTGASWLFPGECWLAVDEGDGRVERVLPALTRGLGFRKLLYSKLTEYLEDLHSWASVYSRPSYSHFTHIQRLSVCLLLLEGYMCANAVLLSLQDHQATVDLGPFHMPTVSLVTGVFSTLVVLPVGALLSLLFRLSEVSTNKVSSAVHKQRPLDICSVEAHSNALTLDSRTVQPHLSWQHLQQWAQEVWIKKEEHTVLDSQIPWQAPATVGEKEEGQGICHGKSSNKLQKNHCEYGWFLKDQNCDGSEITLPPWCRCLAWTLCVTLSLVCGTVTAILGTEFSATKCLLWFKALFSSLLLCGFVLQPALIFIAATVVAVQYRRSCHFHRCSDTTTAMETLKRWNHNGGQSLKNDLLSPYAHPQDHALAFSQVIAARQRARRLRLARPPTLAELRVQGHMKKQRLIHTALREAVLHVSMLFLLMAISAGKSSEKYYLLNEAIKTEFTRSTHIAFQAIHTHEDWWHWSLTTLVDGLYWETWYNNVSTKSEASAVHGKCVLIGEPTVTKVDAINGSMCQAPSIFEGLIPGCMSAYNPMEMAHRGQELAATHRRCEHTACYKGVWTRIGLGLNRSAAVARLQRLREEGWLSRNTQRVVVQFTLFNPPTSLFTAVSLLVEQSALEGLLPSAVVQSTTVYRTTGILNYVVMACELIFLLRTLLQFYFQMWSLSQQSLRVYWGDAWNWLEATITVITLLYYMSCMYSYVLAADMVDLLQQHNFKAFVNISFICTLEQLTRSLHGLVVFLLLLKCILVLRVNTIMAPAVTVLWGSLSSLLCPLLTATVLIIAFSCLKTLHFLNPSHPFSDLVGSFQRVLIHCVMIGVVTSITKAAKKDSRRKDLVTFSEMAVYIQNRIHVLTGKRKKTQNAHHTTHCNFYLEELEVLVVELLDKLETITDNLHHIHPSQMVGNKGKERSVTPWMDLTCGQIFEMCANEKCVWEMKCKKKKALKTHTDVKNMQFFSGEEVPHQHHLRTKAQLKPFQQRLSPEVTCPAAFGVSSHPQHLEELRMESITEMTLTEGIKSFSSYNDSAVSSGQSRPCNLAQHRDVFPHLLCESKCPGKQAVHCCQTDLCTRKLCTCHSKAHKPFPLYPCVEWEGHEQVVEAADRSLQVERSLSVNTLVQCSSAIAKNSY